MKSMRCYPEAMTRLLHIIVHKSKEPQQATRSRSTKVSRGTCIKNDMVTLVNFVTHDLGK